MEKLYLTAAIVCLLLVAAARVWCLLRKNNKQQKAETETSGSFDLKEVQSFMLKEYSCYSSSKDPLFCHLLKVNRYNPETRPADSMDRWFEEATPQLMHSDSCLAYINHYGYIEDTFWKNIRKLGLHPEQDVKFQRLLISVYRLKTFGIWTENFCNLLFHFGAHYRLLPELEQILINDSRFADAKQTYELARKHSEEESGN